MRSLTLSIAAAGIAAVSTLSAARSETRISYQLSISKICSATSFCELVYPTTPANRRVDIQYINCLAAIQSGDLELISAKVFPQDIIFYLPIASTSEGAGVKEYFANLPTSAVVPAGNHLQIGAETFAAANIQVSCMITGTLVFLP